MSDLKQLGSLAKEASRVLATMGTNEKNHALTMDCRWSGSGCS